MNIYHICSYIFKMYTSPATLHVVTATAVTLRASILACLCAAFLANNGGHEQALLLRRSGQLSCLSQAHMHRHKHARTHARRTRTQIHKQTHQPLQHCTVVSVMHARQQPSPVLGACPLLIPAQTALTTKREHHV